ncbi:hypothetical protein [Sulfurisphaera tokodaii]|uniref:Uncharacterized protein n=2 Tax=Sulfurisphaera tokodaii TaxID=111955 RepID=Q96Z35_SULTO|nr:hypothetical protein [Sulfurisphaera tokodaii]BAB67091.1 hypothetical protein STK_19970 [Sulfurisphaera tokodaii str. 7]HII73399.1 hypothetical protein [Sulfurisphaera tokodaii]
MVRYIHYISEGEIRDEFYSYIVNYLLQNNIPSIAIPEMVISNNKRTDLIAYICRGSCFPFMLIEFKNELKQTSHAKVVNQALNYSSIINPCYTVIVDLTSSPFYLVIYKGNSQIYDKAYDSYQALVNDFFKNFLSQSQENCTASYTTFNGVINKILTAPTYERFLRAEFSRILNNLGYYALSECSSISPTGLNIIKPDLVVYKNEDVSDYDYPLLVLEFKSNYAPSAMYQIQEYVKALLPYYYGVVYGIGNQIKVEIFDMQGKQVVNEILSLGNPYLSDKAIEHIMSKLPPVPKPKPSPLNGQIKISELVKQGAKVSKLSLHRKVRVGVLGFSLFLDKGGVRYPNYDYRIIIDFPAKLARLVFFDPSGQLEWCEFKNGELVRCNVPVDAVMASFPCSRLFDKIFPM